MDFRVTLTQLAIQDLKEIVSWIAPDDKHVARRYGDKLIDKALSIGKFPEMGRVVAEYGKTSFREIKHGPYRIIYRVFKNRRQIDVLRFWHTARGTPEIAFNL